MMSGSADIARRGRDKRSTPGSAPTGDYSTSPMLEENPTGQKPTDTDDQRTDQDEHDQPPEWGHIR